MLNVNLYEDSRNVYSLDFIKDKEEQILVVCPSPLVADIFRENLKIKMGVNVLTISRFMADTSSELLGDIEIVKKSDLMLRLASIWKIKFENLSAEVFLQAFNLFTELRSFTLDLSLLDEVFETLDSDIAMAIKFFWIYLESEEIVDEQKSYGLINQKLKLENNDVGLGKQNIIFWGFPHMNAHQIDLINNLSLRSNVYIPFSKDVFSQTNRQDWIRWLQPEEIELSPKIINKKMKALLFPKGRMGSYLKKILKEGDGKSVFLAQKKPEIEQYLEIPVSGGNFRCQIDFFEREMGSSLKLLEKMILEGMNSEEIISSLKEHLKESLENKKFKEVSVLNIFLKAIVSYYELSTVNEHLSLFDLFILRETIPLDLPRNYIIPLREEKFERNYYGLESLNDSIDEVGVLCISSKQRPIKSFGQKFSAEVSMILSSLGPIQRGELDFLEVKRIIQNLCEKEKLILCLEDGILDHDLGWNEILHDGELIEKIEDTSQEENKKRDFLKEKSIEEGKKDQLLSATRIQVYHDCPRKYYYEYVDRVKSDVELKSDLLPFELGLIEHDIIGRFFKENEDLEGFNEFVKNEFTKFLLEKGKRLSLNLYESYYTEIKVYCRNGLLELFKLKKAFPKMSYEFEKPIEVYGNFKGSVDFFAKTSLGIVILDFKRSSGSVPDNKSLLSFEKIQLWFYLNEVLKNEVSNLLLAGYINLSEIEKSRFLVPDMELTEKLKESGFCNGALKPIRGFNFIEKREEYNLLQEELIERLKNDIRFPIRPLTKKVCDYCTVRKVCTREESL